MHVALSQHAHVCRVSGHCNTLQCKLGTHSRNLELTLEHVARSSTPSSLLVWPCEVHYDVKFIWHLVSLSKSGAAWMPFPSVFFVASNASVVRCGAALPGRPVSGSGLVMLSSVLLLGRSRPSRNTGCTSRLHLRTCPHCVAPRGAARLLAEVVDLALATLLGARLYAGFRTVTGGPHSSTALPRAGRERNKQAKLHCATTKQICF